MPDRLPRVTYWLHHWSPGQEGISNGVEILRAETQAPVVAFGAGLPTRWRAGERVLTLSARRWITLRAAAAFIEPRGELSHVFGGPRSWHLLRALGRRPIVLTIVEASDPDVVFDAAQIATLVVETDASARRWRDRGVPAEHVAVIPPGVDLGAWALPPRPLESGDRLSLLFASTPESAAEIEPRGLNVLVELAKLRPDVDIVVPWRLWGDAAASARALDRLDPPPNLVIRREPIADMRPVFAQAHATICCFAAGIGKACPNFVIEGLAASRPAILTSSMELADMVGEGRAGLAVARNAISLADAIDRLRSAWAEYPGRARALAHARFGLQAFRSAYRELYARTAAERRP